MIWLITLNVDVVLLWYEGGEGPFIFEQSFRIPLGGTWQPSRATPGHLPSYWQTEEYCRVEVFVGEYTPPETNILDWWVPPDGFSDDERWNDR